ncbi:MAG: hypothetical protein RLZZ618_606 [Pseudomonadota bacterium]
MGGDGGGGLLRGPVGMTAQMDAARMDAATETAHIGSTRQHGGPDALGVPRWDFSTNAHPMGPAPSAWQAVQQADATRYPDPDSMALRERLAAFHGVGATRIVIAASASEFIFRLTGVVSSRSRQATVFSPQPGYADYSAAAQAFTLRRVPMPGDAHLVWHADPGSPCGLSVRAPQVRDGALLVIDRAYAPLQLEGSPAVAPSTAWQLWSPNKALGLTGVRAAYAVAPPEADTRVLDALAARAPSWPLGAHGVALLAAWTLADTQSWLAESLATLRDWKSRQVALCEGLGWTVQPSVTPFFVARGPDAPALQRLRHQGVKLRDTASLGLPGWVRLSVQPPEAQQALAHAWREAA